MVITMIGWVVWGAPWFVMGDALGAEGTPDPAKLRLAQLLPFFGAFLTSMGGGISTPAYGWIISNRATQVRFRTCAAPVQAPAPAASNHQQRMAVARAC